MAPTHGLYVAAVLCLLVAASEALVRSTPLRHLGTALVVIVLTAIVANLGVLPAGSTDANPVPVYNGVFTYVAPISIFWLLLRVNLRDVLEAGGSMITLFVVGSLGTTVGIVLGMWAIGAPAIIGAKQAALGGMFVGTYTGGSVNFNAVALSYDMVTDGALYAGSVAVDNILTSVWMIVTLAMPVVLAPLWSLGEPSADDPEAPDAAAASGPELGIDDDTESVHPIDLALTFFSGLAALSLAQTAEAAWTVAGVSVPSIIWITIFALVIAQFPSVVGRLKGAQALGMFAVYLFLAVIGAFCDLRALQGMGSLGLVILGFAGIGLLVHGAVTLGAARLLRVDLDTAAMVSQANVGGGTSALALARSRGRTDLVLPAVLLGSLGNAMGTFLGFWAAGSLLPLIA